MVPLDPIFFFQFIILTFTVFGINLTQSVFIRKAFIIQPAFSD